MSARTMTLVIAACAMSSVVAQTPSWNSSGGASSLPKQPPSAVVHNAVSSTAAVATAGQPPRDRDCKSQVTRPETPYETQFTKWYTDGTEDHGQILNQVAGVTRVVQANLNDLQVRIEQLRCEDENIKAKLDYIIRTMQPH